MVNIIMNKQQYFKQIVTIKFTVKSNKLIFIINNIATNYLFFVILHAILHAILQTNCFQL